MTGQELFTEVTGRDADNWAHLSEISRKSWEMRAAGELAFIPSSLLASSPEFITTVRDIPDPEIPAEWIELNDKRITQGPRTVINRLLKHGWSVRASYCRGPATKQVEKVETLTVDNDGNEVVTGEEKIRYGQADSIAVRARRGSVRLAAVWILKPWLSDPKYKLDIAQARPGGKINSDGLKALTESEEA